VWYRPRHIGEDQPPPDSISQTATNMTAVAKASSKTPADHSSARPHRFARVWWPVRSSSFSCMVCLPRGASGLSRVTVGARAPPGPRAPHDLRVLWDVRRILLVYIGLGQVPGEEGGDVLQLTTWNCTADDARPATSAGPRQLR